MLVTKESARARAKMLRAWLPAHARLALDSQVTHRAQLELDWADYSRVHLYLPIDAQHEISTWPLLRWLWDKYPTILTYAPVIRDGVMQQVPVSGQSRFREGRFSIPEPMDGVISATGLFDLVVVPLLAFDDSGHRVGYGRGYYDKFLSTQPQSLKVALAYEEWRVDGRIAAEPHDIRLNAAITEKTTHRFTHAIA